MAVIFEKKKIAAVPSHSPLHDRLHSPYQHVFHPAPHCFDEANLASLAHFLVSPHFLSLYVLVYNAFSSRQALTCPAAATRIS